MGALDLATPDMSDAMTDAQAQRDAAPSNNPNDYGALPAMAPKLDPEDVESRKKVLNNATQRILAARNSMGTPYGGMDLGGIGAVQGALSGYSGPAAQGIGGMLSGQAMGTEKQRQANIENSQQQLGMDLRAGMSQILASPTMSDEDKLQSIYQMSVLSGDEKGAQSAAQMLRAMRSGIAGRAVTVLDPRDNKIKMMSSQEAVNVGAAPVQRDPQGRIINSSGGTSQQVPDKIQQIWKDNNLQPEQVGKDEFKDNEAQFRKVRDQHDAAMGASRVASEAQGALSDYWAGPMGQTFADWDATLPVALQSKAAQNTQMLNKLSGQISMQIAQASKGIRIGVGMEKFAKSTTFDPKNAKDVNEQIIKNIQDLPTITQQQKDMEAYTKQFASAQGEAIKDAFFQDYPMMIDQGDDKAAIVNPAYKDPSLFRKWMSGQAPAATNVQGAVATNATSAQQGVQYKTPEDIKAAYRANKIDRATAKKLLVAHDYH